MPPAGGGRAEARHRTHRRVPISPLPPPPSNGPRPAAAQLVAWRPVWRPARRAARRLDDAMACRREHSVLLAGVDVVRVRRSPHFKQLWRGPGD